MKYLMILLIACIVPQAFSQKKDVSPAYDNDIQKIINKVEGKQEVSTTVENNFKPETEAQKELNKEIESYWNALLKEDFVTTYSMMCKGYQDVVSLSKYLSKRRLKPSKGLIRSVEFKGEDCVRVKGYLWGADGASAMGTLKVPLHRVMFKEDGKWKIFENPYRNLMGITPPKARKFKAPCEF